MNVGEYGIQFNLNVSYNISAFTGLIITFTRPSGSTFTRTGANVTAPAVPLVTDIGTFAASQYAQTYFQLGDISEAGTYRARLTYDNSGLTPALHLVSDDTVTFTVNR